MRTKFHLALSWRVFRYVFFISRHLPIEFGPSSFTISQSLRIGYQQNNETAAMLVSQTNPV